MEIKNDQRRKAAQSCLRMQLSISQEELKKLPLIQFNGKIAIINNEHSLNGAVEELLTQKVVGFDTEARPSFKKGEYHPTSLVQFATHKKCFLIRLLSTGLSDKLVDLFEEKNVTKIGIGLYDDLNDLKRFRQFRPRGFVDLNKIAVNLGMDNIGAKKLSGIFLKGRISKSQQTSNWENPDLTEAQQSYAATDAWICLRVYKEILKLHPEIQE